jgi:hypothetical protein
MRKYSSFQVVEDFLVPLLELIAGMLGQQGKVSAIREAFKHQFGDLVSTSLNDWEEDFIDILLELVAMKLAKNMRGGIYRVTKMGQIWLRNQPDELHIDKTKLPRRQRRRHRTEGPAQPDELVTFVVTDQEFTRTGNEVLEFARHAISAGLPLAAERYHQWALEVDGHLIGLRWLFSEITGINKGITPYHGRDVFGRRMGLNVVRVANKTKKNRQTLVSSANSQEELHWLDVISQQVQLAREFLQGRTERPSDERLCDLVQLCYSLKLFREGRDLFNLVDGNSVNTWHYDRTRRMARICRVKVESASG